MKRLLQYVDLKAKLAHPDTGAPSVAEAEAQEKQEKQARVDALKECLPKPPQR